MPVMLAGIDEAGYGPLLGPLTVAMAVFRVEDWTPGQAAPDLWRLLGSAVSREARDKRGRIPVADSKRLKLPNDSATRHPLTHLERGVLAFMSQSEAAGNGAGDGSARGPIGTDAELLGRLGATHTGLAWYGGEAGALPVAGTPEQHAVDANLLRGALASAGVRVVALRCVVVDEAAFNDIVRRTGTKGEATLHAIGRHLRWLRKRLAGGGDQAGEGLAVRVVCDRLGGRTAYGDLLARELEVAVRATEESARVSRYEFDPDWAALFQPECESAHLAVALASMTAKLVRELAMARFNRYWGARVADLKPTAGYRADAARWLRDAGGALTAEVRREMIRIA
ncbi:MAG: hypothetical protein KDA05_07315 [Phycisphaerales bacterium]|nr:hypothetical protein [Phycisphaerales bacterium]